MKGPGPRAVIPRDAVGIGVGEGCVCSDESYTRVVGNGFGEKDRRALMPLITLVARFTADEYNDSEAVQLLRLIVSHEEHPFDLCARIVQSVLAGKESFAVELPEEDFRI